METTWTYIPRIHPSRQYQTRTGKDGVATVFAQGDTWTAEICTPDETNTSEFTSEAEAKLWADRLFDEYLLDNRTASEIWRETCNRYKKSTTEPFYGLRTVEGWFPLDERTSA